MFFVVVADVWRQINKARQQAAFLHSTGICTSVHDKGLVLKNNHVELLRSYLYLVENTFMTVA